MAFLESEPNENQCDANGDGDRADAILRAFRLGPTEVTAGANMPADAPGSLTAGEYWAVLAFALSANGITLEEPLTPELAAELTIPR